MGDSVASAGATGSLIQLSSTIRLNGLWVGPATAAAAGILAGGAIEWSRSSLLHAATLLLLADLGWGNLWRAVAATDWASLYADWNAWPGSRGAAGALPTADLVSLAGRVVPWWADLYSWSRRVLWPRRGTQLGAILVCVPLAVVLSAALGPAVLLLTFAVLSLCQLALLLGPADGRANPLAQAAVEMCIPWLAGVIVFGRLTGGHVMIAVGALLAYGGLLLVGQEKRGGVLLAAGSGIAVLTLAMLDRPLAVIAVGMLYLAQLALLPWRSAGLSGHAAVRLAQWPFLAALTIAAVAL